MSKSIVTLEQQSHLVVKDNDMIQRSRHSLSLTEQRVILFLISKIKPTDNFLKPYKFTVSEFCGVCGLNDHTSGTYYSYIKDTIKELRDKSFWVRIGTVEELFSWLDTAKIDEADGTISITLSQSITPYLLGLKERFTSYELTNILAMRSNYSVRLYELLKSYSGLNSKGFTLDELRLRVDASVYTRFVDLKRRVIEPAVREINEFSDLTVKYEILKSGKKVTHVRFFIQEKCDEERRASIARRRKRLDRHASVHPEEQLLLANFLDGITKEKAP